MVGAADQEIPFDRADVAGVVAVVAVVAEEEVVNVGGKGRCPCRELLCANDPDTFTQYQIIGPRGFLNGRARTLGR